MQCSPQQKVYLLNVIKVAETCTNCTLQVSLHVTNSPYIGQEQLLR